MLENQKGARKRVRLGGAEGWDGEEDTEHMRAERAVELGE